MRNDYSEMNTEELLDEMERCNDMRDCETAHVIADDLLVVMLRRMASESEWESDVDDFIESYRGVGKWYA